MALYFIKASLIIGLLWAFYKLVLEQESFYKLNRFYLLAGLGLAIWLPFVQLPSIVEGQGLIAAYWNEQFGEQTTPLVQAEPIPNSENSLAPPPNHTPGINLVLPSPGISNTQTDHILSDMVVIPELTTSEKTNWHDWMIWLYVFGAGVLACNLLLQIGVLLRRIRQTNDRIEDGSSTILNLHESVEPCSFFRYIFINPADYDYETYEQILTHEKIHVQQKHSWDLLIAELAMVFFWFNPFIWWYRKAIEKNLEFQTDHLLVKANAEQKESYQLNLLKIATHQKPLAITSNYNQSLIKQRIIKMNTPQSNPFSYWKYAFLAPLLFMSLLLLNLPTELQAQQSTESLQLVIKPAPTFEPQVSVSGSFSEEPLETFSPIQEPIPAFATRPRFEPETMNPERFDAPVEADFSTPTPSPEPMPEPMAEPMPNAEPVSGKLNDLLEAVRDGDFKSIKRLLSRGQDINENAYGVGTAMTVAVHEENLKMVKFLYSKGADINQNSYGVGTPLTVAVRHGQMDIVKFLISNDVEIDGNSYGIGTPLTIAIQNENVGLVKYLISQGVNLDQNSYGIGTPMTIAVHSEDENLIRYLIKKGASLNQNSYGIGTPLIVAQKAQNFDMVKLLVANGADVNEASYGVGTPLIYAINNGDEYTAKYLIRKGADVDKNAYGIGTPLVVAVKKQNMGIIKLLIAKGADLDQNSYGVGTPLIEATKYGNKEIAKYLLAKGADVNMKSYGLGTALTVAVYEKQYQMIPLLIDYGADPRISFPKDGHQDRFNQDQLQVIQNLITPKGRQY